MHFHHLHFYVRDVAFWQAWFIHKLAFQLGARELPGTGRPYPVILIQGNIEVRLSGSTSSTTVPADAEADRYLQKHPPGLVDVAFASDRFDYLLAQLQRQGAQFLTQVTLNADGQRQCQIQGWADLRHTLVEVSPEWATEQQQEGTGDTSWLSAIDHVVLNVPQGELLAASNWYQQVFGLETGQKFDITTARSGLRSQVLIHPEGTLQLPINEPSSANSQIQEFLNHNRGAGVQHVALRSRDAVRAITHFRQQQLPLISVPDTYYEGLQQRSDCPIGDTSAASRQQLLLDWAQGGQQGMLLQTFTQPIFPEPTFFFEIIERSAYIEKGQTKVAQGFGEGNFQALFEAIERAQVARGSLE